MEMGARTGESLAARTAAEKWVRRIAWTAAAGSGMGGEKNPRNMSELGCADGRKGNGCGETAADGVDARSGWKWVGIALVMSEDGCGREMGAENCADG